MGIIKVVCGIIHNGDRILLCRRSSHKLQGGLWEFPGGKIESDELPISCLIRELKEELGMDFIPSTHFKTIIHHYDGYTVELIAYRGIFQNATFKLIDHDAYKWVILDELMQYNLAPADIPIAVALLQ